MAFFIIIFIRNDIYCFFFYPFVCFFFSLNFVSWKYLKLMTLLFFYFWIQPPYFPPPFPPQQQVGVEFHPSSGSVQLGNSSSNNDPYSSLNTIHQSHYSSHSQIQRTHDVLRRAEHEALDVSCISAVDYFLSFFKKKKEEEEE